MAAKCSGRARIAGMARSYQELLGFSPVLLLTLALAQIGRIRS